MPSADLNIEFLQSEEWMQFQEATGKETVRLSQDGFSANGIMHGLPMVGKYLYVPRGPIVDRFMIYDLRFTNGMQKLIEEAKKRRANWIRIEPETEEVLGMIRKEVVTFRQAQGGNLTITKAPHDVQPREVFVMDITPSLETLLAQMKPKTRYNIGLSEKRGVKVFATREKKYQEAFLDLIMATADRKEIMPHPRTYYEKFFSVFPEDMCQLFVAEYDGPASTRGDGSSTRGGKVLAANLLMIYGTRATYLHGGSGNEHRDVMAPYLLQWKQIQYAKERRCTEYDFGGVRAVNNQQLTENREQKTENKSSWSGITRFKMGFSPQTQPTVFPGAYDIILNNSKYALYNRLRLLKESFLVMKKFLKM